MDDRWDPSVLLFCLCAAVGAVASLALPAAGGDLPPGFVRELVTDQLDETTSMAWATDGHLWVAGRTGQVWVLHLENGKPPEIELVAGIPVATEGERGISGIAVEPGVVTEDGSDTGRDEHVWLYYTTADEPIRNRVSRFRHVGDQLADETVILDGPVLANTIHNGGGLRFASDGTLFVSTGDDDQGSVTAQDPYDLRGKLLRIRRDGSGATGNPFEAGGGDPRVWATGFRNPWRFSLEPDSETPFIGDVGGDAYEELDLGIPGGNYGWRLAEGPEPPGLPGLVYPVYSYPHTNPLGHAIVGGEHAPPGNFPAEYVGSYFFGDAATGELFRAVFGGDGQLASVEVFGSDAGGGPGAGPVDIRFGPDGALYYLSFVGGRVYRIRYVGSASQPPAVVAVATPASGAAPLTVLLEERDSTGREEDLSYHWELGDGRVSDAPALSAEYAAGVYHVTLTVSDRSGLSTTSPSIRIVSGNVAPSAHVLSPPASRTYVEGETIHFAGKGTDPEEGILPCERLTWTVIFHHRGHTHPFLGPIEGVCEGSFRIESHGEAETFFALHLSVADTGRPLGPGAELAAEAQVEIRPAGAGNPTAW